MNSEARSIKSVLEGTWRSEECCSKSVLEAVWADVTTHPTQPHPTPQARRQPTTGVQTQPDGASSSHLDVARIG